MIDPELREVTERWIAEDVDPATRRELRELLDAATNGSADAVAALGDRMSSMPRFGTAGLRAPIRAGGNGMNRSVVVRTTAGVAEWLRDQGSGGGTAVVGRDARHGSESFAEDAAAVLAAAGFAVRMLPEPLPTPVLAYATTALNAVAGIQITASHNPPQDNGYKLFLQGGIQPISPADDEIEAAIAASPGARSVPREPNWSILDALPEYLSRVAELPRGRARSVRIVATALHGVGARPLRLALEAAGFHDIHFVAAQSEPDPDFPTVAFPNPEEPEATEALLTLASDIDADLALALDPDADRCAVGVREKGTWRMLSGDETGVLLAEHILSTLDQSRTPNPLVATTIVSATMLRSIAAAHGARYAETPTGFKWLVRAGDREGTGLTYAYEEALGHCVDPDYVRDKDGLSAAVLICDLAATAKENGQTLPDLLDALSRRHGVHQTGQISVRVTELTAIADTMRLLRTQRPTVLGGYEVETRDLLPETDALVITGGDGLRVVVRPSGTEPKLKCYLQVVEQVGQEDLDAAKHRAATRLTNLRNAVSELLVLA